MSNRLGRLWLRVLLGVVPALFVLGWSAPAAAYPWMLKHGFAQCRSCHTDPMGGETLTGFGRAMGDSELATQWDGDDTPTKAGELFYGIPEPDWLRLGGSIRVMSFLAELPKDGRDGRVRKPFPMQVDTYGQLRFGNLRLSGSLGLAKVPAGSPHARAAQITTGQGDQLNLISRSHWVGYDITDAVLVRAGRINLPFGMRIPEHVMWARDATSTDRESDQQHGVGIVYAKGQWRGELMGIAGNYQIGPDDYRERGYSLNAEYMIQPGLGVGVSSMVTRAARNRLRPDEKDYVRQAHGLTGRFGPIREFALLAEADVLLSSATTAGYVGMAQADYEPFSGVHFMGTFEAQDRGKVDGTTAVVGQGQPQFGGWFSINWYFFTHCDFRVDLVARQQSPVTIQSQLHFYF